MKEHNADYLSNNSLSWHPRLGIHAANVAPEFGVCETSKIVDILKQNKMSDLLKHFINLSVKSKNGKNGLLIQKKFLIWKKL